MVQIIKQLGTKKGETRGFLVKGQFRKFKSSEGEVIQLKKTHCYVYIWLLDYPLTLPENYVLRTDDYFEMST